MSKRFTVSANMCIYGYDYISQTLLVRRLGRPADEEASRDLIILINSSVQEGLLAARGPCAPTSRITSMADLGGTNRRYPKCKKLCLFPQTEIYKTYAPRNKGSVQIKCYWCEHRSLDLWMSLASEHQWFIVILFSLFLKPILHNHTLHTFCMRLT